jgi:Sec-independent protein secretion pathway component TatC
VAVPAALYLLAILIAGNAPVSSLVIYVGTIVLYFIAIFVDRLTAPSGGENDFT